MGPSPVQSWPLASISTSDDDLEAAPTVHLITAFVVVWCSYMGFLK